MRTRVKRPWAAGVALAVAAAGLLLAAPAAALGTGSVAGVVTDEDGRPVADVTVIPSGIGLAATTAADGSYELTGLPAGGYHLWFQPAAGSGYAPGYFPDGGTAATSQAVTVVADQRTEGADVVLEFGGVLRGRMVGTDGTPVVEQLIGVAGPDAVENTSVVTGLDGSFEVDALGDRDYTLYFGTAPGEELSVPQHLVVRGRPGWEVVLPDVVVRWNGLVTGQVRDEQGMPVEGVDVQLVSAYDRMWVAATTRSRADGTYQLRGVGAGVWRVRTHTTLGPTGPVGSHVPTYWSARGSTETFERSGGVWAPTPDDLLKDIDLTVRRTGGAVVDLGVTVLHGSGVEWTTVKVAATGGAGVPSGSVQVVGASNGYLYDEVRLDGSGEGELTMSLGWPLPDLSLLYTGDPAYAPTTLTVRRETFTPYPPASGLVAMEPRRLVDSTLEPGSPRCARVAGRYTIPADATGAVVNVTAVGPDGPGYVVLYPDTDGTGATPPPAQGATVNFEPGADVSNAAFVGLSDGRLCWASPAAGGRTRVVVDVAGYVGPDAGIVLQAHERILDTRSSGALRPRELTTVQVTGHGNVPDGASAVLLNVAVTNVRSAGHLRIQPGAVGEAVTTHYVGGAAKSVAALATLSPSGSLTLWSETARDVDVVLDVVGWVADSEVYHAITPTRIVDSRPGAPAALRRVPGPLAAGAVHSLPVRGVGVVPADATAVVLSVTAISPDGVGNLSLYPDTDGDGTTPRPFASNINYIAGRNIPNLVVVALPSNGQINLVSDMPPGGKVDVAIEVVGYLTDPPG